MKFNIILLSLIVTLITYTTCSTYLTDRVLLQDVSVLTFKPGQYTSDHILPQMNCKGIYCDETYNYNVNSIQCKNTGFDGHDVNWKCTAYINNKSSRYEYFVNNFQVMCKGYSYPDDPYILHGSCSVDYKVDKKLIKLPEQPRTHVHTQTTITDHNNYYNNDDDDWLTFFALLFILFFIIALFSFPIYRTVTVYDTPRRAYFWDTHYYTCPVYYPVYTGTSRYRTTSTSTSTTTTTTPSSSGLSSPSSTKSQGASNTRRR